MRGVHGLAAHAGLDGLSGGVLGFRSQAMSGAKRRVAEVFMNAGASTFVVRATGWHDILLYGPGGNGGSTPGASASGGGGGGASLKRAWLRAGELVDCVVATAGATTTGALTGRFSFSATSGAQGNTGYVSAGAGGIGSGGDINRRGGRGHGWTNPDSDLDTNDGDSVFAEWGEFGGTATPDGGSLGSGGGGAGFRDIIPTLAGTGGRNGFEGVAPGGGGYGATASHPGADGAVVFIYSK